MAFRNSPSPLQFFGLWKWIDGRSLLDTIEPYRREILQGALYTFDGDRPRYNLALNGRGKKNWKTSDLILAVLYRFMAWESPAGNDAFVLANDEGQAGDDLSLAKKLFQANPELLREVDIQQKQIVRRDGRGVLQILPARDASGAHGKTYSICAFDEIHGYRNHDLFEALAPDPTRHDALTWITSYAGIRHAPGIPLHDFLKAGKAGDDPRMFFTWYAGDFTTDPALQDAPPEVKANPSMASWGNDDYLAQQRRRLPTNKFRRLHLNLPGAPDGAAFDGDKVVSAVITGRKRVPPATEGKPAYIAYVDMSGGSNDESALAIAHRDSKENVVVLDSLMTQAGKPPFNPRDAIRKFAAEIKDYGLTRVHGDNYAGQTFRADFAEHGITYEVANRSAHEIYEAFEPILNAGEVELLDDPKLQEQLLTLVFRGGKITHVSGDHDDFANAACGAVVMSTRKRGPMVISADTLAKVANMGGPNWRNGFSPMPSGPLSLGRLR